MEKWRHIKTAPKNREIWVCGLARLWAESDPFIWQGQAAFSDGDWIAISYDDAGNPLKIEPTHWRKLPKIPKSKL